MLLIATSPAFTQKCSLVLKGHIQDTDSREKLAGATVTIVELKKDIVTDSEGDFIFTGICPGNYTLRVSHVSCETKEVKISLTKDRHIDIQLPHLKNTLGAITLNSRKGTANTGFKKELSERQMDETKGLNLAEVLSRLNGVNMLQTGSTISKPIIHGLHSNRILTINNGVRQEGQQWGNEHAPEIDPFVAGKLEVVKGVDELKYGSDAIGGVILVEPKPLMSQPGSSAELNSAYFTNNRQYVFSGVFEQQLKSLPNFTYRVQGTYKRGANASTPDYRLNNTASEEKNYSLTAGWKKHQFSTELFYSFFDTKVGIFEGSHIGNIPDLENAIDSDRPDPVYTGENTYTIGRPNQDVQHYLAKSKTVIQNGKHKFTLLLATQLNYRKEFDIIRNSQSKVPQLDLGIATYSTDLNWQFNNKKRFTQQAGIAAAKQENQYAGRYFIPAYKSNTIGGFYISKWHNSVWNVEAGIRFDHKDINSNRVRQGGEIFDENHFNFNTLGSSFNAGYKITSRWKINSNIALANRAPQVNELLSNGIHHGTATFETGDINLQPERAVNISLNNSWENKKGTFGIEATLYNNSISNFIYQQPKPDEPVLTIAGAFPLLVYQQTNARLSGIDFTSRVNITKPFIWELKYSMLRGRNKDLDDWLIRMPADRLQNSFSYNFNDSKQFTGTYFSVDYAYTLKQTRVPDETNGRQDYKPAPGAYGLVNADVGTTIRIKTLPLSFSIAVRNALNTVYRDYLNNLRYFTDETGRNIQFRLKIPIKK